MKTCTICLKEYAKNTKYCCRACYAKSPRSIETKEKMSKASLGKPKSEAMRKALSASTKGKAKPWQQGTNNVNYAGAYSSLPEVKEKYLAAVKTRGQPWSEQHRKDHSQRMLGNSNAMRGKRHTFETKLKVSLVKKKQNLEGTVKRSLSSISKAEKAIAQFLTSQGLEFKQQYHLKGYPYWFDFYIPSLKLIIEYQGDYWHANPKKYPSGAMLAIVNKGLVKVDTIWELDALKKKAVLDSGLNFKEIWESDYKIKSNYLVLTILNEKI